jgi:hypothetical protein
MPVVRQLLNRKLALFGLIVIVVVVAASVFAPLVAPYEPDTQMFEGLTLEGAPLPPNDQFILGTDLLGRDLLSRLIYGARTSLVIGVVANGTAVVLGALIGITAGFFRGWIGAILMRFTDLMMAFPALLLAIALAALFSPSLWIVAMVIAMVNWVQIARVIYAETCSIAERDFIEAEWAIGAGRGAHPVPPHSAAPRLDHRRVGHSGHRHHRSAGGDAELPRASACSRRPRAGATSSSRTRPTSPRRRGWSSSPGCHHPAGAVLQPRRRRAARHPRPDAEGAH